MIEGCSTRRQDKKMAVEIKKNRKKKNRDEDNNKGWFLILYIEKTYKRIGRREEKKGKKDERKQRVKMYKNLKLERSQKVGKEKEWNELNK